MNTQQESPNKINKQERGLRLYHGSDPAFIKEDGSITIKVQSGQWLEYAGGDEKSFRFGQFRGKEALDEAKRRFLGSQKT